MVGVLLLWRTEKGLRGMDVRCAMCSLLEHIAIRTGILSFCCPPHES
jgi:hypothetical protein